MRIPGCMAASHRNGRPPDYPGGNPGKIGPLPSTPGIDPAPAGLSNTISALAALGIRFLPQVGGLNPGRDPVQHAVEPESEPLVPGVCGVRVDIILDNPQEMPEPAVGPQALGPFAHSDLDLRRIQAAGRQT